MIIADFKCPRCKAVFDLEDVDPGQLVDCTQCGTTFEVPAGKLNRAPQKISIVSTVHPPMHPGKKAVNIGVILMILAAVVAFIPGWGAGLAGVFLIVGFVIVVVGRMVEP